MNFLKNALLMLLIVAAGSAIGVFGARWMLAESPADAVEQIDALPPQIASHTQPVVFTLSTCPACAQLKQWMGQQEIDYVEYSLDTDDAAAKLGSELGIRSVPVVYTARHRITGFAPEALAEHLRPVPGA